MEEQVNFEKRLEELVNGFVAAIGYPRQLKVSAAYYPYHDPDAAEVYPNSGQPGCYVSAAAGKVKYIGKAGRHLGNRIWSQIGRKKRPNETTEPFPNAEKWVVESKPHIGVWSIAVPDEHWWLASALEGSLSDTFFPGKNRQI